jgi:hypothetical protein
MVYTNEMVTPVKWIWKRQLSKFSSSYLDVKKKIGSKGGQRNIPDGYLSDISGQTPRLYVVEKEWAAHDPLRHIAVQILQFSLSFKDEPRRVKTILFDTLRELPFVKTKCEECAVRQGFRNLVVHQEGN